MSLFGSSWDEEINRDDITIGVPIHDLSSFESDDFDLTISNALKDDGIDLISSYEKDLLHFLDMD